MVSCFRHSVFHVTSIIMSFLFAYMVFANSEVPKSRMRRHVVFTKSSKYFFRFNGKLNTLNFTTIVAFGYTIRMNWDLPHDSKNRFLFFKRDIHDDISDIPDELSVLLLKLRTDLNIMVNNKQNHETNGNQNTSLVGATNSFANMFANPDHSANGLQCSHHLSVFSPTSNEMCANVFAGLDGFIQTIKVGRCHPRKMLAFQGFSCVLKNLCQMYSYFLMADSCGFFCEMGKLISAESGYEAQFFKNVISKCDYYENMCPHRSPESTTISYG